MGGTLVGGTLMGYTITAIHDNYTSRKVGTGTT